MTDHRKNEALVRMISTALAAGDGAVVVILRGGGKHTTALEMTSTLMTAEVAVAVAEFALEQAIGMAERDTPYDRAERGLPHLRDALRSFQAAFAVVRGDTIGPVVGRA